MVTKFVMNVGKFFIKNFYFDAKNVKMHIIEIKNAWEVLMIFLVIKRFNKKGQNKNEWRIINSPYGFC